MTKSATAWAGFKALIGSLGLALAVGLLLAGSNFSSERLLVPLCAYGFKAACDAGRFWESYWFFIFVWLYEPLQWVFLVLLVRRFAAPGYRLHTAGFLCALYGALMLAGVLTSLVARSTSRTLESVVYLMGGALLLGIGLFLWLRPKNIGKERGAVGP